MEWRGDGAGVRQRIAYEMMFCLIALGGSSGQVSFAFAALYGVAPAL